MSTHSIHSYRDAALLRQPQRLAQFQAILNVPFKRGARETSIEYFDSRELEALFKSIDRASAQGLERPVFREVGPSDARFEGLFLTGSEKCNT